MYELGLIFSCNPLNLNSVMAELGKGTLCPRYWCNFFRHDVPNHVENITSVVNLIAEHSTSMMQLDNKGKKD